MSTRAFIFECSTATCLDCVQKGLFGSNLPWPLQIKKGDYCCLYDYEVGIHVQNKQPSDISTSPLRANLNSNPQISVHNIAAQPPSPVAALTSRLHA